MARRRGVLSGLPRLEDAWRREAPHVLGALVRRYGRFEDCEDAAQEALLAATAQWSRDGVPQDPRAWLIRVASRRLIDRRRADTARTGREQRDLASSPTDGLLSPAAEDEALAAALAPTLPPAADGDDTLALLLLCCHGALSPASQVALTLRAVAGLTTAQVAAAFLVPEPTMAQRISRAKATLRDRGARLDAVPQDELPARVDAVLRVLYLLFSEGYVASAGADLGDAGLTVEAVRLTRHLLQVLPDHAEATGLLALMLLTEARRPARTDGAGDLIPLAEQDRARWDGARIAEGVRLLEQVLPRGRAGPYQLQAAIAAVHAEAATAEETDWLQICLLYRMLQRLDPSDAVALNLAVAVGMAHGPRAGLEALAPLLGRPAMRRHHRTHAVRAHLLEGAGEVEAALAAYREAARLTRSMPEQRYLNRRAERLAEARSSAAD